MAEHSVEAFRNTTSLPNPKTDHPSNCSISHDSLHAPLAVCYSLIFLLGLIGNLLALWFLWQHSKKNSVHIFLINLALADLIFLLCLPFRIAYHINHTRWRLDSVFCNIVGSIFYVNMYVSIALLGLISIDRYLKLRRSFNQQFFLSGRKSVLICCTVWVGAVVWITPFLTIAKSKAASKKCFEYKQLQKTKWIAYLNAVVVVVFWLVYGALVVCYGKVAKGLLQISEEKPDLPHATKYSKTARNFFVVLFFFTVCFVPYHLQRIFYIISQTSQVPCQWVQVVDKTNEITLLLFAINSCLDPVMYFVLCASVRRRGLQMLRNCFCVDASGGFIQVSGRNKDLST